MADASYLPPVVLEIVVNDGAALTSMAGFKAAVADASSATASGTGAIGKDLEGIGAGAAAGSVAAEDAIGGVAGKVGAGEEEIAAKSTAFSQRTGKAFESLGNAMGSFSLPFGNSVKKMGFSITEGESAATGFGTKLASLARVAAGAGLLIAAAIGVSAIKAADAFDVAQTRLKTVVENTHGSFKALEPSIDATEKKFTNLGFTTTESAGALGTLTTSTGSVTKATGEMGIAADLSRYKHISLAAASETLAKVNAGSLRPLTQLGIQLDIGSLKLTAAVKATEAVTKAKKDLKAAEENYTAAVKKGQEEHAAAVAKVTAADETLKQAQEGLKQDAAGVKAAQDSVKEAMRSQAEVAQKASETEKTAAGAVRLAEEKSSEARKEAARSVATAETTAAESIKAAARTIIESQEAAATAAKSAAKAVESAEESAAEASESASERVAAAKEKQAEGQKAGTKTAAVSLKELKAAEKAVGESSETGALKTAKLIELRLVYAEATEASATTQAKSAKEVAKAEDELTKTQAKGAKSVAEAKESQAESQVTSAKAIAAAEEGQVKTQKSAGLEIEASLRAQTKTERESSREVVAAKHALVKAQQEALPSSKQSVAAANAVAKAQEGVSQADQKVSQDQKQVAKDANAVSVAQEGVTATDAKVTAAHQTLIAAHEKLHTAETTLQKDQTSTSAVMEALKEKIGGSAVAFGKTLAGQVDIAKAKLIEIDVEIGERLTPLLLGLVEALKTVGHALVPLWSGFVSGVQWVGREAANLDILWERNFGKIRTVTEITFKVLEFLFIGLPIKIGEAIVGAIKWLVEFDIKLVKWVLGAGKGVGEFIGFFLSIPEKIGRVFESLISTMFEFGKNMIKGLVNGILSAPGAILKAIKSLIPGSGIIGSVAHVLGLAEGGIVTKPTLAIVGENGPEAVVPLGGKANYDKAGVAPLPQSQSAAPTASSLSGSGLHIDTLQLNGANQTNAQIVTELYQKLRPLLQGV
jgi:hypothetical protein